jgi:hypothetical protein
MFTPAASYSRTPPPHVVGPRRREETLAERNARSTAAVNSWFICSNCSGVLLPARDLPGHILCGDHRRHRFHRLESGVARSARVKLPLS